MVLRTASDTTDDVHIIPEEVHGEPGAVQDNHGMGGDVEGRGAPVDIAEVHREAGTIHHDLGHPEEVPVVMLAVHSTLEDALDAYGAPDDVTLNPPAGEASYKNWKKIHKENVAFHTIIVKYLSEVKPEAITDDCMTSKLLCMLWLVPKEDEAVSSVEEHVEAKLGIISPRKTGSRPFSFINDTENTLKLVIPIINLS